MAFLFGEGVGKRLVITSLSKSVICNIFKTFKFMLAIYVCKISTIYVLLLLPLNSWCLMVVVVLLVLLLVVILV